MKGGNSFFIGNEKDGSFQVIAQHSTGSFAKPLTTFLASWQSSNGNNQTLIDDFIKTMQEQYGITLNLSNEKLNLQNSVNEYWSFYPCDIVVHTDGIFTWICFEERF